MLCSSTKSVCKLIHVHVLAVHVLLTIFLSRPDHGMVNQEAWPGSEAKVTVAMK